MQWLGGKPIDRPCWKKEEVGAKREEEDDKVDWAAEVNWTRKGRGMWKEILVSGGGRWTTTTWRIVLQVNDEKKAEETW